jgi:hypothetical protein
MPLRHIYAALLGLYRVNWQTQMKKEDMENTLKQVVIRYPSPTTFLLVNKIIPNVVDISISPMLGEDPLAHSRLELKQIRSKFFGGSITPGGSPSWQHFLQDRGFLLQNAITDSLHK